MTTSGINSQLVRVFVLQMAFISMITGMGVLAAAIIVEKVMIHQALQSEAEYFWTQLARDPDHPLPHTKNLEGLIAPDGDFSQVPALLHSLDNDFHLVDFPQRGKRIVYVEDHEDARLFLIFDLESIVKLSLWFGVLPLGLVLMVMYASAWVAYRSSSRTLSPIISLADTMRDFDVNKDDIDSLDLDEYIKPAINDEVHTLAESLRSFTARLKAQLQREREFTRDVSHELRTPLSVISGSLQILEKYPLTPPQQRAVKRMHTTSQDMLSLIETLLLLARDINDHGAKHEDVIVNDLVRLLVEQLQATHNKDNHVLIRIDDQQLLSVFAPRQAVGVVIGNLLRNACNYTPDGSVIIKITQEAVTICDTGSGIAENDLERVKQAFQRSSEQTEGHGLGLDIVRRICERNNWTLEIHSVKNQGTEVKVRFIND